MTEYAGMSVSARRVLGLVLLVASPTIALLAWSHNHATLETLAWFEQHRKTPADSAGHASALYHGMHARADEANRWHLTGYATLGVVGTLVGAGLLLTSWKRRTA